MLYLSDALKKFIKTDIMYHSKQFVKEQGKKSGRGRFQHLQALITEFQDCDKESSKTQILANLANFAYDPLNYEYLHQLNVVDLFLDMLNETNEDMVEFGIAGLCNMTVEDKTQDFVISSEDGISRIVGCLSSFNEETVLNTITTLINLITPDTRKQICSDEIVEAMRELMGSSNTRLKNLATIFVTDYCN